jgi:hypothetical protein
VVEELDSEDLPRPHQPKRELPVLARGLGISRGVVVEGDDRGTLKHRRFAKDLARMDEGPAQTPGRDDLELLQTVPRVEHQDSERLERPAPEAWKKKAGRVSRKAELGPRRKRG